MSKQEAYESSLVTKELSQHPKTFRTCVQRFCKIREFENKNELFHISTKWPSKTSEMEMMLTEERSPGFLRRKLDTP